MEKLTALVCARPLLAAVAVVATLIVTFLGMLQGTFVDNLEAAFRSDEPRYQTYAGLKQQFALGENDIFILIESERPVTGEILDAIAEFSLDAQLIDQVAGIVSILSLRDYDPGSGDFKPVLTLPEPGEILPAAALQSAADHPLNLNGSLLSRDLRLLSLRILIAEPAGDSRELGEYAEIIDSLQAGFGQTVGAFPVETHWSGIPLLRLNVIERLIRDQAVLNSIGGLLGLVGCIIMLGSWRLAVVTSIAPAVAVIWLIGSMGHLSLSFNVITNVLPVLVLVIGFADAMHLSFNWRRIAAKAPEDRQRAIKKTMVEVGPACMLTSATTAVAFLSLLINDSELIRGFGIAGFLAVALTLLAVLLVHPLAMTLALRYRFITDAEFAPRRVDTLLDGVVSRSTGFVFRHPKAIAASSLILSIFAFLLFAQVEPRYTFLENVPPDSSIAQTVRKLDAAFGGTQSLDVVIPFDDADDEKLSVSLDRLKTVHEALEAVVLPHPVVSAWSLVRVIGQPPPPDFQNRFRETLNTLQARQRSPLIAKDRDQALLQIMLPDRGSPNTRTLAGEVEQALTDLDQDHVMSGILLVSAQISADMIRQLNWSIFATGLFSAFLLAIAFRRPAYVVYALLPNILPIILVGAFLQITGQGLQFSGALAMTIALGIAVDDTIHLLSRMKHHEREAGIGIPIISALTEVGPVLISTSFILVLGIAVTGFSQMPTIANFGFLSGLVIILALAADLLVLPAIVLTLKGKTPRRSTVSDPGGSAG